MEKAKNKKAPTGPVTKTVMDHYKRSRYPLYPSLGEKALAALNYLPTVIDKKFNMSDADNALLRESQAMFDHKNLSEKQLDDVSHGNFHKPGPSANELTRQMAEFTDQINDLSLDWEPDSDGTRHASLDYHSSETGHMPSFAGTSLEKQLHLATYEGDYTKDSVANISIRRSERLVFAELDMKTSRHFDSSSKRTTSDYREMFIADLDTGDFVMATNTQRRQYMATDSGLEIFDLIRQAVSTPDTDDSDSTEASPPSE